MILICVKLCVVIQPKILKNSNNLFKQLFFNASYLFFMQKSCRRMSISKCSLDNLEIGITRSNYINFHEILCRYEAINVKNLKQLV
jgi:hypothetical protein